MKIKYLVLSAFNNSGNFDKHPVFENENKALYYKTSKEASGSEHLRIIKAVIPENIDDLVDNFYDIEHYAEYAETQLPYHITLTSEKTGEKAIFTISYDDVVYSLGLLEKRSSASLVFTDHDGNNDYRINAGHIPALYGIKNHFEKYYENNIKLCKQIRVYLSNTPKASESELKDFLKCSGAEDLIKAQEDSEESSK